MPLINNIPERFEAGFNELASLSESDFLNIQKAIINADATSSLDKLSDKINSSLSDIDVSDILSSVGSLIPYVDNTEMISEIISDIVEIAESSETIEINNSSQFTERLDFLLRDKHIYYASKATDLLNNYSNLFILSRIVTDLRPVFSLDIEDPLSAGVLVHTLHIHYQSNDEPYHKDISITLNKDDLLVLKEAISRAEKKEILLQEVFNKSSLVNLSK